jgi:2-isopropylmalate synthase
VNAIAAVEAGVTHVQGTMNGYGERCGNANLASIIANLELKLGHTTVGPERLTSLASVCRFVAELANLPLRNDQPFVGKSAFAHKGGVHVAAVLKASVTYEHIAPERVGNRQRVLVSDLSGRGNIMYKLKQHGLGDRLSEAARAELLERIKQMEYEGYELEAAEGTYELLVREALNPGTSFFEVDSYEVATRSAHGGSHIGGTVTLRAQDGTLRHGDAATALQRSAFVLCANVSRKAVSPDHRRPAHGLQKFASSIPKGSAANVRVLDRVRAIIARAGPAGRRGSDNVIEGAGRRCVDAIRLS